MRREPLPVTIYVINGQLLVDPTQEEEKAYEARLTVSSDDSGTISALQKGGSLPLRMEDVENMLNLALEKSKFLRGELDRALK